MGEVRWSKAWSRWGTRIRQGQVKEKRPGNLDRLQALRQAGHSSASGGPRAPPWAQELHGASQEAGAAAALSMQKDSQEEASSQDQAQATGSQGLNERQSKGQGEGDVQNGWVTGAAWRGPQPAGPQQTNRRQHQSRQRGGVPGSAPATGRAHAAEQQNQRGGTRSGPPHGGHR